MKYLVIIFVLLSSVSISQSRIIKIVDSQSKKPIYDANARPINDLRYERSNIMGFLKINIPVGDTLVISHYSYEVSEVIIPEAPSFIIQLDRYYYDLDSINLDKRPIAFDNPGQALEDRFKDAVGVTTYQEGWNAMYTDLGYAIIESKEFDEITEDFKTTVLFTVSKNAEITEIDFVPNPPKEAEFLTAQIKLLTNWAPYSFREVKHDQHFKIKLFRTGQLISNIQREAEPVGGIEMFYQYIRKNMQYPEEAKKKNVEGQVFVQFVVDELGQLTNIAIQKGIGYGCDEEAIRLIENSPNWEPPLQRGIPITQKMVIPITFQL